MERIYSIEDPILTRILVIRADRSVSTRLINGDTGSRTDWTGVSRARAAQYLVYAMHSPVAVIGRVLANVASHTHHIRPDGSCVEHDSRC